MSQADALLNGLSEEDIAACTVGTDAEKHIIISRDRRVTVPNELKRIAVQYDKNIETVTFDCPRYWDGHDLSTMIVSINYRCPDKTKNSHLVDDVTIDANDSSIMHFTWTITRDITRMHGTISFLVCIRDTAEETEETIHWNSELNKDMYVSEGLECV